MQAASTGSEATPLLNVTEQVRPTSAPSYSESKVSGSQIFKALNKFKLMNYVETTTFGNKSACPSS